MNKWPNWSQACGLTSSFTTRSAPISRSDIGPREKSIGPRSAGDGPGEDHNKSRPRGLSSIWGPLYWQTFFEDNTWIFGYGLRYQFLTTVVAQPSYGGTTVTGRGGQRGDFLTAS